MHLPVTTLFVFLCLHFCLCQLPLDVAEHNDTKELQRAKRGFLEYVSTLPDLNWIHKLLEMVFGELYTDAIAEERAVVTMPPPPPLPAKFENNFRPWLKNITANGMFTRQSPHPVQVSLPYPHIFTTPKSRRPTSTTEPPTTPPPPPEASTNGFFQRMTAPFTARPLERGTEATASGPYFSSKNATLPPSPPPALPPTEFSGRTCDSCQVGKQCSLKLRSFETTDPVFQYAYSHGTPMTEVMEAVLKDTQTLSIPPPLTWKYTASPEVVQLTTSLMNLYKPNRSLVIGVFTGLALVGIASVTDSRGIVIGLEYPENVHFWERIGMKYAQRAGIINRIQVRSAENVDKALTKLAAYEPNAFDFIFMSEIRKTNTLDDYEHSVRLLRTNGLLVITDALEDGAVIANQDPSGSPEVKVVQSMNTRIKSDPRVSASLLPYGGGTWIIVKN